MSGTRGILSQNMSLKVEPKGQNLDCRFTYDHTVCIWLAKLMVPRSRVSGDVSFCDDGILAVGIGGGDTSRLLRVRIRWAEFSSGVVDI